MDYQKNEQKALCAKYSAEYFEVIPSLKVGISLDRANGTYPINGLRHPPEGDTSGWYIWFGEHFSEDTEFFKPMHIAHLNDYCPEIIKFLGLPPGWRFLTTPEYEDVWEDPNLLNLK